MSPEAYNAEILGTLKDLRDKVSKIEGILLALCAGKGIDPGQGAKATGGAAQPAKKVASDDDLDSQWGDPAIRKDPPRWDGDSYAGCKYSECPPEYLDILAGFLDWKAEKDDEKGTPEGTKYARYARNDAARARGWSQRKRNGWAPLPGAGAADSYDPDDDIAF